MTYVKAYLPTLKTHVVNLKRDAKVLTRDLQRLEVRGKLGSKTFYCLSPPRPQWREARVTTRSHKKNGKADSCVPSRLRFSFARLIKRQGSSLTLIHSNFFFSSTKSQTSFSQTLVNNMME